MSLNVKIKVHLKYAFKSAVAKRDRYLILGGEGVGGGGRSVILLKPVSYKNFNFLQALQLYLLQFFLERPYLKCDSFIYGVNELWNE